MKTLKHYLSLLVLLVLGSIPFYIYSQNTQMYNWVLPPNQINFSSSGVLTSTALPTVTGYSEAPPSNAAYDVNNNLLFFVTGGNVFDASGTFKGSLPTASVSGNSYSYRDDIGAEDQIEIVPVPGTCQAFYVIYPVVYLTPDGVIDNIVYMYATVTCSGGTASVSPTGVQTSSNIITTNIVTGGANETAMAVSHVISGTGSSAIRYLYIVFNPDGSGPININRYTISSSGISNTATVAGTWSGSMFGLRIAQAALDYTGNNSLAWSCESPTFGNPPNLYVLNLSSPGPGNAATAYPFPSGSSPCGVAFDAYGNIFAGNSAGIFEWSAGSFITTTSSSTYTITNSSNYNSSQLAVGRDGVPVSGTYVNHIYAVSNSGTLGYIDPSVGASSLTVTASPLSSVTVSSISPAGQAAYFLLPTEVDGENYSDFFGLTVPLISITPTNPVICSGTSTTLTASGGSSYQWSNGSTNPSSGILTPSNTTNYTVTATSSAGCTASASSTVTVHTSPATPSVNNATLCSGGIVVLSTTESTSGCTYQWSSSPATVGSIPSNQNIIIAAQTVTGETYPVQTATTATYTVTVTSASGCSATASATVTESGTIAPVTITPSPGATVCAGTTISLTANSTGSPSYQWESNVQLYTNSGCSIPYCVSCGSPSEVYLDPSAGSYQVNVIATNNGCKAISPNIAITVNPGITIAVEASENTICGGSGVSVLAASSSLGTSSANYTWSSVGGSGTITTADPICGFSVTPTATTSYAITVTNGYGCTATGSTTVNVNPAPTPTVNNATICTGGIAILDASDVTSGVTYQWSTGSTQQNIVIASQTNTTASYTQGNRV